MCTYTSHIRICARCRREDTVRTSKLPFPLTCYIAELVPTHPKQENDG